MLVFRFNTFPFPLFCFFVFSSNVSASVLSSVIIFLYITTVLFLVEKRLNGMRHPVRTLRERDLK